MEERLTCLCSEQDIVHDVHRFRRICAQHTNKTDQSSKGCAFESLLNGFGTNDLYSDVYAFSLRNPQDLRCPVRCFAVVDEVRCSQLSSDFEFLVRRRGCDDCCTGRCCDLESLSMKTSRAHRSRTMTA